MERAIKSFRVIDPKTGKVLEGEIDQVTKKVEKERPFFYYCSFFSGKLHGPCRYFSKEGTLLSETIFWMGKKMGVSTKYYPSKKLYAKELYSDGKKEGLHEFYFPDGTLRMHLPYKDDLLDGTVKLFWENGEKKRVVTFSLGEKIGKDLMYRKEELSEV